MTNISKPHQRLSNHLNEPRVLEYPQEFLGPNYEAVLDFWLFHDDLTQDQWKTINSRYWDFFDNHRSEWRKATDEAIKVSEETIRWEFAYEAAWAVYCAAARLATRELIGMHILLEQQKSLTFFNMFLEP